MAKAVPVEPLGNWHKLFGEFETSPTEFYASVEQGIRRRKIPDVLVSRVDWRESGLTSAKRQYLRVTRGQYVFDICAAPFGTGFFFSWWFAQGRPGALGSTLLVLLVSIVTMIGSVTLAGEIGVAFGLIALIVLFVLTGMYLAQGESELAGQLLGVPLLGKLWEAIFLPATYFRIDSQTMFRSAVHASVMEAIDGLTEAKGLKALSEEERKPVMKEFFKNVTS